MHFLLPPSSVCRQQFPGVALVLLDVKVSVECIGES